MSYLVYKLEAADGRVYIGMTGQSLTMRCRASAYNGCPAMRQAIAEFGWESFKKSILQDGLTKSEAEQVEREMIAYYNSTDPTYGFNVDLAGNVAGRHSVTTLRRMSESQKGRVFTEEHLRKLRKPKCGGMLRRTVRQFTENGELIREYGSLSDAVAAVSGRKDCIIRCCGGKQRSHKGFRWEYGGGTG